DAPAGLPVSVAARKNDVSTVRRELRLGETRQAQQVHDAHWPGRLGTDRRGADPCNRDGALGRKGHNRATGQGGTKSFHENFAERAILPPMKVLWIAIALLLCAAPATAQAPVPVEADYVAKDFRFQTGESLPALTLHYRTLGTPRRDATGVVRNAVLILHGTGGSGAGFLSRTIGGALVGPGEM